jgi:hypothetical protein
MREDRNAELLRERAPRRRLHELGSNVNGTRHQLERLPRSAA